jgi:hypothetical protein
MERLNGTVRERLKVMRGFDGADTGQKILDGERFYYNNIRPHMGLGMLTPGQVAGVPFVPVDDDPWLTFLNVSVDEIMRKRRGPAVIYL